MREIQSIVPQGFSYTAHPIFSADHAPKYRQHASSSIVNSSSSSGDSNSLKEIVQDGGINYNCCSICLESYQVPITLVNCLHSFCFDCLLAWYEVRKSCPMCKSESPHFVRYLNTKDDGSIVLWRLTSSDLSISKNYGVPSDEQLDIAVNKHRKKFHPAIVDTGSKQNDNNNFTNEEPDKDQSKVRALSVTNDNSIDVNASDDSSVSRGKKKKRKKSRNHESDKDKRRRTVL